MDPIAMLSVHSFKLDNISIIIMGIMMKKTNEKKNVTHS